MAIKAVFLDCDGTLTKVKSSWEYLHRRLNLWNGNADRHQELFKQGRIDYHESCARDALLWRGLRVADAMRLVGEIPYQRGVRGLVRGLRQRRILTAIVSTGLSLLTHKAAQDLGIDMVLSNELVSDGGVLTGGIRINVEHDGKGRPVRRILIERGLGKDEACAIGDGEGDIGMFEEVGLPIGFHPGANIRPFVRHALQSGHLAEALRIIENHGVGQ